MNLPVSEMRRALIEPAYATRDPLTTL